MQMRYIIQGINGLEDSVYCKELRLSAAVNRIYRGKVKKDILKVLKKREKVVHSTRMLLDRRRKGKQEIGKDF